MRHHGRLPCPVPQSRHVHGQGLGDHQGPGDDISSEGGTPNRDCSLERHPSRGRQKIWDCDTPPQRVPQNAVEVGQGGRTREWITRAGVDGMDKYTGSTHPQALSVDYNQGSVGINYLPYQVSCKNGICVLPGSGGCGNRRMSLNRKSGRCCGGGTSLRGGDNRHHNM